ncbi:uncharacterized protein LOC125764851 isoform X2 [Anopheles funestus]|uniref:uncharacterized protein LOC125764851 isoform X2 n=1 Tax=Anopheles funestus TaxID=62324 RepID=UPI0020C6975C|nr:uncharacterized protein LOC125764851 isoform X2 [Anopheles funestus]
MGRNLEMARKLSMKTYSAADNTYESSSGSDSDESNASLLERSCLLSNKFMLPKDLCENVSIFHELFSRTLWDTLPQTTQQKLAKLLPVAKDDMPSATKVVHSLMSQELQRFGKEPMDDFRCKLANGSFRVDIAKLKHNLAELTKKDKRMVELQRMSRLAPKVMLSREAVLYSELHSNDGRAVPSFGRVTDNYDRRRQWKYDFNVSSAMEKYQAVAKKRYLSEIINICDEVGLPMSLSDEEDCMHALPTGTTRKQRRMVGTGPQSSEQSNVLPRPGTFGSFNGTAGNTFDGTIFNAPKVFLVTEEHYRKLLLQHRKRKMEEPDHPELDLDNIKLKDVVSRTQIAAGYRRILPLPKVHISDALKDNSTTMKGKVKSQKSLKMHRTSLDQPDSKGTFERNFGEHQNVERVKTEPSVATNVKVKEEQPTSDCFDSVLNENVVSNVISTRSDEKSTMSNDESVKEDKRNFNAIVETKLETADTFSTSTIMNTAQSTKPLSNESLFDAMVENVEQNSTEQSSMNCLFSNGTHACFLSVVRDLFCSNPDHRSTLPELRLKLDAWTKSPVAERNVWFEQYKNIGEWNDTLQSAVQFLTGEFVNQPEDFVPYIEHKVSLNILQWIGASRDGDSRLVQLCAYWQSRKQEINKPSSQHSLTASNAPCMSGSIVNDSSLMQAVSASPKCRSRTTVASKHVPFSPSYSPSSSMSSVSSLPIAVDNSLFNESTVSSLSIKTATLSEDDGTINERSTATPPPLFPTDWTVRKATDQEIESFREQEKRRYENPHMAFTYKQHSYDSVVGPVKGIYTQAPGISKARGHSMLVANRPNFVTILTLVRDATARLPNGEGTRADICELLKSSQYISPTATDQVLQTIVSGALDRMHTERDPCVKYDAKRKIWIYLHRNRTEQEFERLHMQYQGFTKHKKSIVRKPLRQSKESISTSSTAKHDLLNDSGTSVESFTLNSSMIKMDQDLQATVGCIAMDPTINTDTAIINAEIPISSSTCGTSVGKSTTSLLKKQTPLTLSSDNINVQQPCNDIKSDIHSSIVKGLTSDVNTPCQADQAKQPICIVKEQQTVTPEPSTNVLYKSSNKLCSAVTLNSSVGNNIRTIQIPKSSLTLANIPVVSNTSTAIANETSTSDDGLSPDSLTNINPKSPKKILVSAIVSSSVKSTPSPSVSASAKSVVDISRISNSKPILVQSIGTASSSHTPAAYSFVSSPKDAIKIGSAVGGGTIVSIRQVNSNSGISNIGQKNQLLACGQTTSLLSSQSSTQTKGTQLSINNASFTGSSGGTTLQTMKGGAVITATISKPIYSSSVGPAPLKQGTGSAASIIQTNLPGSVFSQKMMVSSCKANTPSSGESNTTVPTIVAIKSTSTPNMTSVTPGGTNRIVKPTTNLFSTITLTKGQQSVLTPAKQRQIIQNLLSQNQKQSLAGNQIVSQAQLLAASASSSSITKVQSGDTKQQYKSGPAYLVENQATAPAFKINPNSSGATTIKTLSPKIVKITPTRSKPQSSIRPVGNISTIVGSSNATVLPASSVINQTAASNVKMIKMNPSTIITSSSEGLSMTNAANISASTAVAVTVPNNAGTIVTPSITKSGTMRVLKTATGSTAVIKTEVTRSVQSTAHHTLENLRKDPSSQIGSKLLVNPNINTGQLIPLESLLQKPGIGSTVNNSVGGLNTILKLAGTTKTGQQFLQFGTSSSPSKPISNLPSNSSGVSTVASAAQQYTILPQTRNIISVASTSATNRSTNLPLTIMSSPSESNGFQSGGSIIVANKKANLGEVNSSADATTSLLSHVANSSSAKLMQQGTKVKLLTTTTHNSNSFGTAPAVSASQQQGSVYNAKTTVPSTVSVSGEFLNAKIIGVRNITSGKIKGTPSLSLMNANSLNIAHIGGKPVLIANSTSVGANQAIAVSTAHLSGATKSGPSSSMVLTGNTSSNSLVLGQPNASSVTVSGVSSTVGREITRTNSGTSIPGQIQTVLLRNNLLKVQTAPNKLSHPQSIVSGTLSSSGVNSGINPAATALIATSGQCSTAHSKPQPQQQQQYKSQKQQQNINSGGNAVIIAPNIPSNPMVLGRAVGEETPTTYVKIQSSDAELTNNLDSVSQSPRVVISQPIIMASDIQKTGTSINLKRLKVIPISKQPNK